MYGKMDHYVMARFRQDAARTLKYIVLALFSISTLYPFFWVIISAFKNNNEIYGRPFNLPSSWAFHNFHKAWIGARVDISLLNSLIYSFLSVALILLISSMTAYVLTRYTKTKILFTYFILGIMIPIHSIIIPEFFVIKTMGLYNSRFGLILVYIAGNISIRIFILSGFMKGIPKALEDASFIDGCSKAKTFFLIILPILKPALATVGILVFLNCWNDLLMALLFLSRPDFRTLNLACYNLRAEFQEDYGLISAGLVILIIPVTVIYIMFQEQVIKGLTAGAVKG